MSQDHDPLQDADLTFLLGIAFQVVLAEFVRRLDQAGYADLRPVHGLVFQELRGAGLTGTELSERLGVTKQAVGQLITDLEERGYVRREPHPHGGRWRLIVLTDKAQNHLEVAGTIFHQLEGEFAERMGGADLAALRLDLSKLIRGVVGDEVPPLRPTW